MSLGGNTGKYQTAVQVWRNTQDIRDYLVGPSELVEVKGGKGPPEDRVSQNSQKQY
ncbi:hypothetical protein [Candidatus Burkholderia verschuerenii]|uniref:hypothetical protein n=1 Tax=Candidatus Burkholderia verschuerenii TaxID=242163 RepID=UPI0012EDEC09|nr:hypothetical protein [Candidatus Burkholderia verschuerenii]